MDPRIVGLLGGGIRGLERSRVLSGATVNLGALHHHSAFLEKEEDKRCGLGKFPVWGDWAPQVFALSREITNAGPPIGATLATRP
jgi:hypothetical protein